MLFQGLLSVLFGMVPLGLSLSLRELTRERAALAKN
jgi:hypothetical protein